MNGRGLILLWLCVSVAVWNATFDHEVVTASRDYLLKNATWELGRGPQPVMGDLMSAGVRTGAIKASAWTAILLLAAFLTFRARR